MFSKTLYLYYLLVHIPYVNSTNANDKLRRRNKNKFLELSLANMSLWRSKRRKKLTWVQRNTWPLTNWSVLKTKAVEMTYRSHSYIRDLSFTPGLKSSLLKLSLLVNGSMPTWSKQQLIGHFHDRRPSKLTWHSLTAHFLCTRNDSRDRFVTTVALH